MNKLTIFFSLIFCLAFIQGNTQSLSRSVISAAGSSNEQLSFTVGETVIATGSGPSIILTQGFQQPDRLFPDFVHPLGRETTFELYPNPAKQSLTLELNTSMAFKLLISFTDMRGRSVLKEQSLLVQNQTATDFDVSTLASGAYVMILRLEDGTASRSIRFQKVN